MQPITLRFLIRASCLSFLAPKLVADGDDGYALLGSGAPAAMVVDLNFDLLCLGLLFLEGGGGYNLGGKGWLKMVVSG